MNKYIRLLRYINYLMLKRAINIHTATNVIFNDEFLIILMSNVNQKFIIPMRIKKI